MNDTEPLGYLIFNFSDPFLFSGDVRYNLDPFKEFSQENIIKAIKMCGLTSTFPAHKWGLIEDDETSVDSICSQMLDLRVNDFSVGQKQLVCLGRCLLREAKLVLVDEATSSLDPQAESKMIESLISSIPWSTTVLIICHNPDAVTPFCNVIVELEKGTLKRFDVSDAIL